MFGVLPVEEPKPYFLCGPHPLFDLGVVEGEERALHAFRIDVAEIDGEEFLQLHESIV